MGQGLRGFVAQGLDGQKTPPETYVARYGPGTFTWTCPASGYYRFVQWGAGSQAVGANGGGSGAHTQTVVALAAGQTVALALSTDCTATFPGGRVVVAGGAPGTAGGVASGGDLNLNGSAGGAGTGVTGSNGLGTAGGTGGAGDGTSGGGAGAPGQGTYRGGDGAGTQGRVPGGGGRTGAAVGGDGEILIVRQYSSRL